MVKYDEIMLMEAYLLYENEIAIHLADILSIVDNTIPFGRVRYILQKWDNKGYIEYGTSVRSLWLTAKGKETFRRLIHESKH